MDYFFCSCAHKQVIRPKRFIFKPKPLKTYQGINKNCGPAVRVLTQLWLWRMVMPLLSRV